MSTSLALMPAAHDALALNRAGLDDAELLNLPDDRSRAKKDTSMLWPSDPCLPGRRLPTSM
jgi:hypothetical protein